MKFCENCGLEISLIENVNLICPCNDLPYPDNIGMPLKRKWVNKDELKDIYPDNEIRK